MSRKKHRKSDHFFRNVLIGFGTIFLTLIVLIIVFEASSEELKYSSFDEINNYDDIYSIDDQKFLLYFYSESCGACQNIKTSSLSFFKQYEDDLPVYMMDATRIKGSKDILILPFGEELTSTPTLMVVENGIITEFYIGTVEISNFYSSFQE